MNKFFVYGTLKKGGFFAKHFDHIRTSSKVAILHEHDLFTIGDFSIKFPGAVAGKGKVIGEIHEFPQSQTTMITNKIDNIEGYYEKNKSESLYLRKIIPVELEDGSIIDANVYLFNGPIKKYHKKIESGIWEI